MEDTQDSVASTQALKEKKAMSAERLQALAVARQKATEVRRQKAAQKAEARELQRLERELEKQNLAKRRQELEGALRRGAQEECAPTNPRDHTPEPRRKVTKRAPPASDSSDDSEPEEQRVDVKQAYHAKVRQMKEDLVFRSIFG